MLHIGAGIGRAPVEGFLDGKGTYSGMCYTWYAVGETATCGRTKRKTREGRYSGAHIELCISANPILRTQTMEKRVSLTGGGGCI